MRYYRKLYFGFKQCNYVCKMHSHSVKYPTNRCKKYAPILDLLLQGPQINSREYSQNRRNLSINVKIHVLEASASSGPNFTKVTLAAPSFAFSFFASFSCCPLRPGAVTTDSRI